MAVQILQVNFRFDLARAEYEQAADQLAQAFAELGGLRWKIWILNEAEKEAGGIYLFEDNASLQNFLNGPLAAKVAAHPSFRDFSAKSFAVMAAPTAVTRGPI